MITADRPSASQPLPGGKPAPRFRMLICLAVLLSLWGPISAQQPPEMTPAEKTVVLLFKFLLGTDWPEKALPDPAAPFVVGVINNDPILPTLSKITKKVVRKRRIVIKRCASAEEARGCHLLFISSGAEAAIGDSLENLTQAGILTIGESENFTDRGGVVRITPGETVAFEISGRALQRARLRIDTGLKEIGRVLK